MTIDPRVACAINFKLHYLSVASLAVLSQPVLCSYSQMYVKPNICFAGAPPINVALEQIGISMVRVTWTAPAFAPPDSGYQVRIALGSQMSGTVDEQGTSTDVLTIPGQYGMYVARVMSLSNHFSGQTAESEEVAVLGEDSSFV